MKHLIFILYFSVLANHTVFAQSKTPSVTKFDFSKAPKPEQWRSFMAAPFSELEKLHLLYKEKGLDKSFRSISWEWRMAWVRRCQKRNEALCLKRLSQSLEDPALVVRSAAARAFAERYRGTKDPKALAILEHVFKNPANYRKGRSLFVQESILSAIHAIGGLSARSLGHRLSKADPSLQSFWKTLNAAKL
ncbi:hypothetical protein N9D31_03240 [Oligoflexaceae bacterium]|nr:hypothetical protein [Oligoflexaceae bacterium]